MLNLANATRYWAGWNPDGLALATEDGDLTWAETYQRACGLAAGIRARGVGHGDRVGIVSANRLEYCELVLALQLLGAITVPLNVRLTAPELAYLIEHSGCSVLVSDGDHAELARAAVADLDGSDPLLVGFDPGFAVGFDELRDDDPSDPGVEVDGDDVAYLCYTSGTTGLPKGAMLTHANVWAMATHRILADDMTTEVRMYLPFPLAFTGGLVSSWAPTQVCGGTLVLDRDFEPGQALARMAERRVTNFAAVPVIWEMILAHSDFPTTDLRSLRVCASGGAPVPRVLLERLQDAGLPMSQGYGLTEGAGMNTWLRAADARRKLGSAGRPMMHSQVRVVNEELADVAVGEVGELVISGPEVMAGYWKDPEATASTIVDGWLRTGDLARLDDEGFVYIVDRAKDMLISGGLNVYPAEIERVLASIEGVAECAVIGVADDTWGEVPMALIGPAPGAHLDPDEISARCAAELADYKRPKRIVVRDQPLPRGMSGKILKRDLRHEYDGGQE